uniref:Uncharacterized protein n=1 Tax=Meloidogyne incognita TaxID=6306 RepID=A0A914LPT0_MELIC
MLQALFRFRHFQTHQIWSMHKSIRRNYRNWGLSNSKTASDISKRIKFGVCTKSIRRNYRNWGLSNSKIKT